MAIREAEPVGSLSEVKEAGLDREDLLGVYRNMLITRGIEERGHILYRQGKIPGSFYTGRGNEAASVAIGTAMGSDDVGTPRRTRLVRRGRRRARRHARSDELRRRAAPAGRLRLRQQPVGVLDADAP